MHHIYDSLRKFLPWWLRYYYRLQVSGIENLPKQHSAIIAGNHSGGFDLDNFAIMSALDHFSQLPQHRQRIWECYHDRWAVDEYIWARWVQRFSPIPINLDGKGFPYPLIDRIVQRNELLAIMPEGHSASVHEGYLLWKFYPGVIRLHLRYEIPIIPTAFIGFVTAAPIISTRYVPTMIPPWVDEVMIFPFFPRQLQIHFGKPIDFREYYGQTLSKAKLYELASRVRDEMKTEIARYRKDISVQNPLGRPIKRKKEKSQKGQKSQKG